MQAKGLDSEDIPLTRVFHDSVLSYSLVSEETASKTGAKLEKMENDLLLEDDTGQKNISNGSITLQWRATGTLRSGKEVFHVVPKLRNNLEAILGKHVEPLAAPNVKVGQPSEVQPLELSRLTHGNAAYFP